MCIVFIYSLGITKVTLISERNHIYFLDKMTKKPDNKIKNEELQLKLNEFIRRKKSENNALKKLIRSISSRNNQSENN